MKKSSNSEIAKSMGLTRQTYEYRIDNWVTHQLNDGSFIWVNPNQSMKLKGSYGGSKFKSG